MSQLRESGHDDQQLVRYLLGLLPDEDAEHLDEMSIVDDEVADRLRAVENDLVDAYVNGSLAGETLVRFESFYLSSPRRRQHVRFAEGFLRTVNRAAAAPAEEARGQFIRAPADAPAGAWSRLLPHLRLAPQSRPVWGLAAAAAMLLLACGALLFQGVRLQNGLAETKRESAALQSLARELEQQLNEQRAVSADAVKELERARAVSAALAQQAAAARTPDRTGPASQALKAVALVLLPQTRALGPIAALAVPPGTERVTFELRLESNDFPRYEVALKDPATSQTLWRSERITAKSPDDQPTVSVIVPAGILKPQHYSLELTGRSAAGTAEVVGSYTVRILP